MSWGTIIWSMAPSAFFTLTANHSAASGNTHAARTNLRFP